MECYRSAFREDEKAFATNYAFSNPIRFVDPDGMEPQDWYKSKNGKTVKWFKGSDEQNGYDHVGATAKIESSGKNAGTVNLNSDCSATNAETGESTDTSISGNTEIVTRTAALYKKNWGPGPDANPYSLSDKSGGYITPANELDVGAQGHDLQYYFKGASGFGAQSEISMSQMPTTNWQKLRSTYLAGECFCKTIRLQIKKS